MREIKFRGKIAISSGWAYGHYALVKENGREYSVIYENGRPLIVRIHTVSQYTGLKDKNGKELYFNDYIHVYFGGKYDKTAPIKDIYDLCNLIRLIEDHGATFKIYGNTYDNPELLEESK